MDRTELYDKMAERKSAPKDFGTYIGDNGRVNRCVQLMKQGKIRTGGTLLDVGGGIGDLGCAAREAKLFDVTIVADISPKNLEAARSKGNMTLRVDVDRDGLNLEDDFGTYGPDADWKPYKGDGKIDTITALDFIEHIVDPENFARECYRLLKPGGEVFINTPNIQFWRHIETLIAGRMPHTSGDRDVYHGGHLAFFTYDDLCDIFSTAGFKPADQIRDDEGFAAPPPWIFQIRKITTQPEYLRACERYGNSNLLFKATKA